MYSLAVPLHEGPYPFILLHCVDSLLFLLQQDSGQADRNADGRDGPQLSVEFEVGSQGDANKGLVE